MKRIMRWNISSPFSSFFLYGLRAAVRQERAKDERERRRLSGGPATVLVLAMLENRTIRTTLASSNIPVQ